MVVALTVLFLFLGGIISIRILLIVIGYRYNKLKTTTSVDIESTNNPNLNTESQKSQRSTPKQGAKNLIIGYDVDITPTSSKPIPKTPSVPENENEELQCNEVNMLQTANNDVN